MKSLITDSEVEELRAQAEGSRPFAHSELLERLTALDDGKWRNLPPRECLAVGHYLAARRFFERDVLRRVKR